MSKKKIFKKTVENPKFPELEEKILKMWEQVDIEKKIQEKHANDPPFVFLEGPPTANGLPHMGHALTRAIKDVFLRYWTMKGHRVTPRIGGWDCHGLPVELEVEKQLGFSGKDDIEKYGVAEFNQLCRESVLKYVREWVQMTKRIGFHLDMEHPYVTMTNEYIESVWWSLKQLFDKNLLFKGHKVVPYCPRCGTPLSSHEVALGYKDADDPSIYIRFQSKKDPHLYFVAWTTTPWTLPSNLLLAVKASAEYVKVKPKGSNDVHVIAKVLMNSVFDPKEVEIIDVVKGEDLEDEEYVPLFDFTPVQEGKSHRIKTATFVTLEEGTTGIVHVAPAFGADDYELCREHGVELFNPVDLEGKFDHSLPRIGGKFVKDADEVIMQWLEEEGKLLKRGTITHTYPFCWRCSSPLLYYAIDTWYIGMSQLRDRLVELNEQIFWKPNHLKHGRFGNFLKEAKDWALSRNRYWGTPLPIWVCEQGHYSCVGSVEELKQWSLEPVSDPLDLHRPYIDEIRIKCHECGQPASREPHVIDCWYDSGSAPFAQWHYPFEHQDEFKDHFPVDFITEAHDQTRGWFYSLHAVATAVFDSIAYKRVLSMGHVLDQEGKKMSKSLGNVVSPNDMFDQFGADATRWLLYSTPTWNNIRFGPDLVREAMRLFQLPLWNTYSFFMTYAELDGFDPRDEKFELEKDERDLLDQWLLSRLQHLIRDVRDAMEDFEVHRAVHHFREFMDDLSNLWLRASRRRFWEKEITKSKISGYQTLYDVLVTLSKLLAPFMPFMAEHLYQTLVVPVMDKPADAFPLSVHLESYPMPDDQWINDALDEQFSYVKDLIVQGRAIRARTNLKIRQPLSQAVVVASRDILDRVQPFAELIKTELNLKDVEFTTDPGKVVEQKIKPHYDKLGPKFRKEANKVGNHLKGLSGSSVENLLKQLEEKGVATINIDGTEYELSSDDFEVVTTNVEGYEGGEFKGGQVFLNTNLTPELKKEGLAREVIRRIQMMRKDLNLDFEQLIDVHYEASTELATVIKEYQSLIKNETLTKSLRRLTSKDKSKSRTAARSKFMEWTITDVEGKQHHLTLDVKPHSEHRN